VLDVGRPPGAVHAGTGDADPSGGTRREHIEAWLVDPGHEAKKAATLSVYYRSPQPFFTWAVSEGEIGSSPMERMRPPMVPEQPVAVLTGAQIDALLWACQGPAFVNRRDEPIVQLLVDTGCAPAGGTL
jgi:site-specific recombinase XerD